MPRDPLRSGLPPTHPGEILREDILPALDLPKTEIARRLGISRQTLYDLTAERLPVTPAMALRLGRFLGNGAAFWLNLQQAYDLHTLGAGMADELARIEPVTA